MRKGFDFMEIINYISIVAVPLVILLIILYGVIEKKKVFDIFIDGTKEGLVTTIKILPTLIGLFLAIGALRSSGIIDGIGKILSPILAILKFPIEILPLALLRPISGSASIATATDIMKIYGVDSQIGIIASVIMGATETTLYTIAVYTGIVKIKKIRFVLLAALIADIVGITTAIIVCRILSMKIY